MCDSCMIIFTFKQRQLLSIWCFEQLIGIHQWLALSQDAIPYTAIPRILPFIGDIFNDKWCKIGNVFGLM